MTNSNIDIKSFKKLSIAEIDDSELHGKNILKIESKLKKNLGEEIQLVIKADGELSFNLFAVNKDAVLIEESPVYELSSNRHNSAKIPVYDSDISMISNLSSDSRQAGTWDGESIYELIELFQEIAKKLNLTNLNELPDYGLLVMQSQRLSNYILKKEKCGYEFSRYKAYFIDKNGMAIIFASTGSNMGFRHDQKAINGVYLCSEENIPKVLSFLKSKSDDYYKSDDRIKLKEIGTYEFFIDTKIDEIKSNSPKESKYVEKFPYKYGLTGEQIKYALQYHSSFHSHESIALSWGSGISISRLIDLRNRFIDDGLLDIKPESSDSLTDHSSIMRLSYKIGLSPFKITIKGNAASMKKRRKRISIKAIEALKNKVEERYLSSLSHPNLNKTPIILGFFGSYLEKENHKDFGDLDIIFNSINNEKLEDNSWKYYNELCALHLKGEFPYKPIKPGMYERADRYSSRVISKYISRSNHTMSIHDLDEVLSLNVRFEIHYILNKKLDKPLTTIDEVKLELDKILKPIDE